MSYTQQWTIPSRYTRMGGVSDKPKTNAAMTHLLSKNDPDKFDVKKQLRAERIVHNIALAC